VSLPPPSVGPASMPYKLFDYFVEAEQKQFYGRERDVEEVVARVASSRTLVLYGRSGIGKTSLVRAGVIPVLVERGFAAVYVRLFRAPLDDLRVQVATALGIAKGPLQEVVAACDKPVVIVLDQLEELFIRFENPDDRRAVAAELEGLLAGAGPDGSSLDVRVVLTLRHDWVASLEDLGPAWSDLLDRRYRLRGLSAFGARRAIVQPLAEAKETFTPKLVNLLVDELDASGFDPLLLQILCSEVYREAVRRKPEAVHADVEDHVAVGGTDGIFLHYLDKVAAQVPEEQQLLLRLVLDAMITTEGTKRVVTVDGLLAARFRATRAEVEAMLGRLVEGRLVRTQAHGETWYELVHDRLVEVTLGWLEHDRDFVEFRFARSLVEDLSRSPRWRDDVNKLLSRGQLEAVVGPYRERLRPDRREGEFLLWSAVAAQSGELSYWAGQYGTARSEGWVLALLESHDARLRQGAAWAAGALRGEDPHGVARCYELALRDPDEGVRHAAAWAFVTLASSLQISELRAALRDTSTRGPARKVLAQAIRVGRYVPRLSLRDQYQGVVLAQKWIREENGADLAEKWISEERREDLATREEAGILRGLLAGLPWWAVVHVAIVLIDVWTRSRIDWFIVGAALIFACLLLPVSAAIGRSAVRAAAYAEHFRQDVRWWIVMRAALPVVRSQYAEHSRQDIRWWRIVFDWHVVPWIAVPHVLPALMSAALNKLTVAQVAGVLVGAVGLIAATLALAQRLLQLGRSGRSRLAWALALVIAAGLPSLPWLLAAGLSNDSLADRIADRMSWGVWTSQLSSITALTLVVVLGLDARRALPASSVAAKPSAPAPPAP
jgi:hypothetical protein